VPVVKRITVNDEEGTISIEPDESRDCKLIEWIANGEVIKTGPSINLNEHEEKLGCYVRFRLVGEGGVTYSQPFELRYEGRVDKKIPSEALDKYRTPMGQVGIAIYRSRPYMISREIVKVIKKKIKKKR